MYSLIHHGRRLVDLQKCRSLRISSVNLFRNDSAFSNLFFSTSSRDGRKGKTFTVSYLIDSFGFTTKLAESISKKVTFEDKANPDSVLSLLRSHGFTDSQISSIVTDYPLLLIEDAEKSLAPKLQSLQSRGASTSELTEIVSTVPKILGKKGGNTISRYYDFVKEVIEADKSFEYKKLCHSLEGSMQENKIRNVLVLREMGVSQRLLFSLLISDNQIVCGKERFEESLKKVVEMGFDPTTSKFVEALKVFYKLSDKTIEEKLCILDKRLGFAVGDVWEIFKKSPISLALSEQKIANSVEAFRGLGFSKDEITTILKNFPRCLSLSAETVKKKTEFVVKQMNWPLKAVALFPQVLGYSMEKRIVPRCNVIKALMSKGSKLPSMEYVLKSTNEVFLNRFVSKLDDKELVAELMSIFTRDHAS